MQQFLYQKNFQKLRAHKNMTIPYAKGRTIKPRKLPQPRQLKDGRRKDICANTTTTKFVDFEASINRTTQITKLEPRKLGLTCYGLIGPRQARVGLGFRALWLAADRSPPSLCPCPRQAFRRTQVADAKPCHCRVASR